MQAEQCCIIKILLVFINNNEQINVIIGIKQQNNLSVRVGKISFLKFSRVKSLFT